MFMGILVLVALKAYLEVTEHHGTKGIVRVDLLIYHKQRSSHVCPDPIHDRIRVPWLDIDQDALGQEQGR